MRSEIVLMRLQSHHGRIAPILERASMALRAQPVVGADLAGLRWELLRALREYQLFKHMEVFDPLMISANRDRARAAGALKDRCLAIADAYREHVARWTIAGAGPTPDRYLGEAEQMVRRIGLHLAQERLGIHALLHHVERTRRG